MFAKEIDTETVIEGTPERVWAILTDFDRYAEWNPGFTRASGRAEVGQRLHLTFAKEGGDGMKMQPTVLVADSGHELRWLGRLLLPGIFDGEHRFEIHELEPGRVRFVQAERFRGVLVPFLRKLIEVDTLTMFGKVNEALAAQVRAQAAA